MPNISSYGSASKMKKSRMGMNKAYKGKGTPKKTAGSSAVATMRRQQADLERRRAQREKTKRK